MRRFATGFLAVTLLVLGGVAAGCAASPTAEPSVSPTPVHVADAYDMRLGPTEPGTEAGTINRSIFIPAYSAGVWLRMSELAPDGVFTRDVCQVVVTDTVQSSSDACSVEVFERDGNGNLQGVVLHVDGLDELGFFETDARKLRQMHDGAWSGETGTRSVKLWGYLSTKGENKHE